MKKKQIQIVAIIFLFVAIGLLYLGTDKSSTASIFGLISGILSALASIISLFSPSSYIHKFNVSDWKEYKDFSIVEIKSSKHGMGKNPTVTTYQKNNTGYEECMCGIEKDDNGNITITVSNHCKIEGKAVITG